MRKLLQRPSNKNHSQVTAGKAMKALKDRRVATSVTHGQIRAAASGATRTHQAKVSCSAPPTPATCRSRRGRRTSAGAGTTGSVRRFLTISTGRSAGVVT
jgi:hypothetical protein